MMIRKKNIVSAVAAIALLLPVTGLAVVIGDWETDLDGWGDWGGGATMVGGQTEGVTLGSGSLLVDHDGYGQTLSIGLNEAQKTAFMENSIFSIDVSVAATEGITSGYSQILAVAFNAPEPAGWYQIEGPDENPVDGWPDALLQLDWWDGGQDDMKTLTVDYSAFRDLIETTDWLEIIITTNNGGGAPSQMYFDNAQLIPEPATIGLIGVAGIGMFVTRRRFRG